MDAARSFEQGRRRRTLVLGVLCAGLGAAIGFGVSNDAVGEGWDRLTYYAAAAAAPTSMLLGGSSWNAANVSARFVAR